MLAGLGRLLGASGLVAALHAGAAPAPELPLASAAAIGAPASTPYGWIDFCSRQPGECMQPPVVARNIALTPGALRAIDRVNRHVNATLQPVSNFEHWGTTLDHWDYPADGKGDCKIYALWKRKLLIEEGFPRQALLITIVRDGAGAGHAVLTVKTDRGDFVLDNLARDIRPWDAAGYVYLKRQAQEDPNVWLSIETPRGAGLAMPPAQARQLG